MKQQPFLFNYEKSGLAIHEDGLPGVQSSKSKLYMGRAQIPVDKTSREQYITRYHPVVGCRCQAQSTRTVAT